VTDQTPSGSRAIGQDLAVDQATLSVASAPDWRDRDSLNIAAKPNDAKLLNPGFSWMCRPLATLQIEPGNIGPGLFIQHGGRHIDLARKHWRQLLDQPRRIDRTPE
jgi:hypothetical protein